jgi:NAD(P)-dependent dehydrogenase (short-subunit alcohol dehydrogenase family)
MSDPFDLTGRVAVITGGSRGLGREMATAFAEHGADVVIASRKADACEAVAKEIAAATGRRAEGIGCHVGKWDDCQRLFDEVNSRFGGAQILVNNAGMSPLYPSVGAISEELYDKVLDVNLKGAFRLAVLFGEQMAANDGGAIINVSSIAAVQPSPIEVTYGMAKAGLNAMTVALARTLAPKVRVNCIMPGSFLTDISKAWDMQAFEKMAKTMIPLGRGGQPNEIVGAALYLASDASSYTTGSILKVDGGATRAVGGG